MRTSLIKTLHNNRLAEFAPDEKLWMLYVFFGREEQIVVSSRDLGI